MYQWDFTFLLRYSSLIGSGIVVTLLFTVATIFAGMLLGLAIGMARLTCGRIVSSIIVFFVEIFRCTPPLVQLVWFYYALPVLLDVEISGIAAAFIVLTLYVASFYAEIFRGGIRSIDRGQWEASRMLGMRFWPMMVTIILPQAVKRMIPPFMNQSVIQLKTTSLVSTIAVPDLLYNGMLITAETYRPLEVYTCVALIYLALLFPATRIAERLESKMSIGR